MESKVKILFCDSENLEDRKLLDRALLRKYYSYDIGI